jgi:DNA repair exonuclease SbcCD nuclease subunit
MTTFLFIGDPHIKSDNGDEIDVLLLEIKRLFSVYKPDYIIIGGDVMHYHEKVFTSPLNKSLEFIREISKLTFTYILVGNHDYENNSQFLSDHHWMNALKEWENLKIVDRVIVEKDYILVPYVYPGRFKEALETSESEEGDWINKKIIFAHQEFKGCKMGAITSTEGDQWDEKYPFVVSGHIHDNQWVGSNIYYPGTPLQHSFGDEEKRVVCLLTINEDEKDENDVKDVKDEKVKVKNLSVNVPTKQIVRMTLKDIKEKWKHFKKESDKIKFKIDTSVEEFKLFKETKEYKEMIEKGIKVQLVKEKTKKSPEQHKKDVGNFESILEKDIEKDEPLVKTIYDELFR